MIHSHSASVTVLVCKVFCANMHFSRHTYIHTQYMPRYQSVARVKTIGNEIQ